MKTKLWIAAALASLVCAQGAYAAAGQDARRGEFEAMFSGGITRQDREILREARQDAVDGKKAALRDKAAALKEMKEKAQAAAANAKAARKAFRADFEQRAKEVRSLTGSARADAMAAIAKDRADLAKATAEARAQLKSEAQSKRKALAQDDADRTKAKIQKAISSVERASPQAQLKALTAMLRNVELQILAQKGAGADDKAAVLETMRAEIAARLELLDPTE